MDVEKESNENSPDGSEKRNKSQRRTSILKPPKPRNPLQEIDFENETNEAVQPTRRVSFSRAQIQEFAESRGKHIWGSTYYIEVCQSDSSIKNATSSDAAEDQLGSYQNKDLINSSDCVYLEHDINSGLEMTDCVESYRTKIFNTSSDSNSMELTMINDLTSRQTSSIMQNSRNCTKIFDTSASSNKLNLTGNYGIVLSDSTCGSNNYNNLMLYNDGTSMSNNSNNLYKFDTKNITNNCTKMWNTSSADISLSLCEKIGGIFTDSVDCATENSIAMTSSNKIETIDDPLWKIHIKNTTNNCTKMWNTSSADISLSLCEKIGGIFTDSVDCATENSIAMTSSHKIETIENPYKISEIENQKGLHLTEACGEIISNDLALETGNNSFKGSEGQLNTEINNSANHSLELVTNPKDLFQNSLCTSSVVNLQNIDVVADNYLFVEFSKSNNPIPNNTTKVNKERKSITIDNCKNNKLLATKSSDSAEKMDLATEKHLLESQVEFSKSINPVSNNTTMVNEDRKSITIDNCGNNKLLATKSSDSAENMDLDTEKHLLESQVEFSKSINPVSNNTAMVHGERKIMPINNCENNDLLATKLSDSCGKTLDGNNTNINIDNENKLETYDHQTSVSAENIDLATGKPLLGAQMEVEFSKSINTVSNNTTMANEKRKSITIDNCGNNKLLATKSFDSAEKMDLAIEKHLLESQVEFSKSNNPVSNNTAMVHGERKIMSINNCESNNLLSTKLSDSCGTTLDDNNTNMNVDNENKLETYDHQASVSAENIDLATEKPLLGSQMEVKFSKSINPVSNNTTMVNEERKSITIDNCGNNKLLATKSSDSAENMDLDTEKHLLESQVEFSKSINPVSNNTAMVHGERKIMSINNCQNNDLLASKLSDSCGKTLDGNNTNINIDNENKLETYDHQTSVSAENIDLATEKSSLGSQMEVEFSKSINPVSNNTAMVHGERKIMSINNCQNNDLLATKLSDSCVKTLDGNNTNINIDNENKLEAYDHQTSASAENIDLATEKPLLGAQMEVEFSKSINPVSNNTAMVHGERKIMSINNCQNNDLLATKLSDSCVKTLDGNNTNINIDNENKLEAYDHQTSASAENIDLATEKPLLGAQMEVEFSKSINQVSNNTVVNGESELMTINNFENNNVVASKSSDCSEQFLDINNTSMDNCNANSLETSDIFISVNKQIVGEMRNENRTLTKELPVLVHENISTEISNKFELNSNNPELSPCSYNLNISHQCSVLPCVTSNESNVPMSGITSYSNENEKVLNQTSNFTCLKDDKCETYTSAPNLMLSYQQLIENEDSVLEVMNDSSETSIIFPTSRKRRNVSPFHLESKKKSMLENHLIPAAKELSDTKMTQFNDKIQHLETSMESSNSDCCFDKSLHSTSSRDTIDMEYSFTDYHKHHVTYIENESNIMDVSVSLTSLDIDNDMNCSKDCEILEVNVLNRKAVESAAGTHINENPIYLQKDSIKRKQITPAALEDTVYKLDCSNFKAGRLCSMENICLTDSEKQEIEAMVRREINQIHSSHTRLNSLKLKYEEFSRKYQTLMNNINFTFKKSIKYKSRIVCLDINYSSDKSIYHDNSLSLSKGPLPTIDCLVAFKESNKCIWDIERVSEKQLIFSFLRNTFTLDILLENENITEIKFLAVPVGEDYIMKFIQHVVIKSFSSDKIMEMCKTETDLMPLLNDISRKIEEMLIFKYDVELLHACHMLKFFANSASIEFITFKSLLRFKLSINLNDWDNIQPKDINIEDAYGNLRVHEVVKLATGIQKDSHFLMNYVNAIHEYLKLMDKFAK